MCRGCVCVVLVGGRVVVWSRGSLEGDEVGLVAGFTVSECGIIFGVVPWNL